MPFGIGGGENIGNAYVRVIMQGDDNDFVNGMRATQKNVERDWGAAGERSGMKFAKRLRRNLSGTLPGIMGTQIKQIARLRGRDLRFFSDLGRNMGNRIATGISDTTTRAIEGGRNIGRAIGTGIRDGYERVSTNTRNRILLSVGKELFYVQKFARIGARAGGAFANGFSRVAGGALGSIDRGTRAGFTNSLRVTTDALQRTGAAFTRAGRRARIDFGNDLESVGRRLRDVGPNLQNLRDRTDRFADSFGRAFGRGSRNDFLNFVGSFTRNTFRATGAVTRFSISAVRNFGKVTQTFGSALGRGQGFGSALATTFTTVLQSSPKLTAALRLLASPQGLAGVAIAAGVAISVLQGLASLFISLGGAAVALGLAIGGALVSALVTLAALLLPIVAGVGGLTAAILLMDDATKRATRQAIAPFVAEMKELGKVFAKSAFARLPQDAKAVAAAFKDPVFTKFAQQVGEGLDNVRHKFVEAFSSDRFREFFRQMGPVFKSQLEDLADITIKFGSGLGGVFLAATPSVNTFLDRLKSVGTEFSNFANSDPGQAKLTEFFNRAERALASVGDLLVSTGRAFATLFNNGGGDAGITLINDITGKLEQFVAFVRANPDTVRQFFGDAVDVTRAVGNALLGIFKLFDALDTHTSRQGVQVFFNTLTGILTVFAGALDFVTQQFDVLGGKFSILGTIGDTLLNIVPGAKAAATGLGLLSKAGSDAHTEVDKPFVPRFDPAGLFPATNALEGIGVLQVDINGRQIAPQGIGSGLTPLQAALSGLDADVARPRNVQVKAPVDPIVALIEKVNFLSLSIGALKENGASALKITAPGLSSVLTQVKGLQTSLSAIRAKVVSVTAPNAAKIIGQLAFINAAVLRPKTLKITSNASAVLQNLADIQSTVLSDKSFTTTNTIKTIREARGAINSFAAGGQFSKAIGSLASGGRVFPRGGFANFRQLYEIGEKGREAVVPLQRPLSLVDPSVRLLAAVAQGKVPVGGGKTTNVSIGSINSNSANSETVAQEALNLIFGRLI